MRIRLKKKLMRKPNCKFLLMLHGVFVSFFVLSFSSHYNVSRYTGSSFFCYSTGVPYVLSSIAILLCCNGPIHLNRQVWANTANPDQTASGAV